MCGGLKVDIHVVTPRSPQATLPCRHSFLQLVAPERQLLLPLPDVHGLWFVAVKGMLHWSTGRNKRYELATML